MKCWNKKCDNEIDKPEEYILCSKCRELPDKKIDTSRGQGVTGDKAKYK